jgi:glutamine amidotransferase
VGNLRDLGLVDTIIAFIESGKPLMGICLGMQLLMSESAEFGKHAGLGIINGCVERFSAIEAHKKIKIPHVGWNSIVPSPSGAEHAWSGTPLSGITGGEMFYFTHSYCAVPRDRGVVLSVTEYDGVTYCSSILQKNVFACQFHPEKSGLNGLQVYRSWAAMIAQRNGE